MMMPVQSPLLKQSQLLAVPPLSDMLKFSGSLHVHQVTDSTRTNRRTGQSGEGPGVWCDWGARRSGRSLSRHSPHTSSPFFAFLFTTTDGDLWQRVHTIRPQAQEPHPQAALAQVRSSTSFSGITIQQQMYAKAPERDRDVHAVFVGRPKPPRADRGG